MTKATGKTTKQDTALALLASGPMTVSEALALGGSALVRALCELTCHRPARVVYTNGAYRMGA